MDTTRRLLQRNTRDGKIGGVAAGLADYFAIDPTIVRLAFVLLVLAGGFGIAAYLVAWLVMPAGDGSTPARAPGTEDDRRWTVGLLVVAVGVVALVGTIGLWWIDEFVFWPFVLIAAGVALLLWRRDEQNRKPPPPSATPPPPGVPPTQPLAGTATGPSAAETATPPAVETTASTEVLPPPPSVPDSRRPSFPVGWVTLAVLTASAAIAGILDATGALDVSARWFLVYAVVVAAVAIVAGSLFGRVLGPILLVIVLTASLAVAWAIDVPVRWSTGDRTVAPISAAELDDEYRLGAGELVLDLRQLELAGASRRVEASVAVGSLVVLTPVDAKTEVEGHASLGEVELYDREENGVDVSSSAADPPTPFEGDRLQLVLDVGIGKVEVR
jgi:phage shock protein PspC (stress-responsive transcriptional regulator)